MAKKKDILTRILDAKRISYGLSCALLYELGLAWHSAMPEAQGDKMLACSWIADHGDPLQSIDAAMATMSSSMSLVGLHELPRSWVAKVGSRTDSKRVHEIEDESAPVAIVTAALMVRADDSSRSNQPEKT